MRIKTEECRDVFLYGTTIENFFINEMLPKAPGNYVKVFIFGQMYSQCHMEIDTVKMAHTLGLTEMELLDAWKYWEKEGLVRIVNSGQFGEASIEFIRQIDMLYGKASDTPQGTAASSDAATDGMSEDTSSKLINHHLRRILEKYQNQTGRTISRKEAESFKAAIIDYGIDPDVLDFAIEYSASLGIEKCNAGYITTVARNWKEAGCETVEQAKSLMDEHELKNGVYKQIFRELSLTRAPMPAEREMIDKWLNEDGYALKDILDACRSTAGLRNPSLNFVAKILKKIELKRGGIVAESSAATSAPLYQDPGNPASKTEENKPEAKVSEKVLKDYYGYIKEKYEQEQASHLDEVKADIPGMRELLDAEMELNRGIIGMKPGPGREEKKKKLRDKRIFLEKEKKRLLVESGRPEDYLTRKYLCNACRDEGYTDGGMFCSCRKERAEEAYQWYRKMMSQKNAAGETARDDKNIP